MITYESVILVSWATFLLVWVILAFNVKQDIRGSYSSFWKQYALFRLILIAAFIFLFIKIGNSPTHITDSSMFNQGTFTRIFAPPLFLGWIGALFSVFGVAFAIWARFSLGRNWSSRPAIKENHELVTTGPYAYVRHPIYTGLILSAFGVLLAGIIFGIVIFIIACIVFSFRIKKEEHIMLQLFPNEYPEYKKNTWTLVPFIW